MYYCGVTASVKVLEEPTKMMRKTLDLGISTRCSWPGIILQKHCEADGSRGVNISRDSQAISSAYRDTIFVSYIVYQINLFTFLHYTP